MLLEPICGRGIPGNLTQCKNLDAVWINCLRHLSGKHMTVNVANLNEASRVFVAEVGFSKHLGSQERTTSVMSNP